MATVPCLHSDQWYWLSFSLKPLFWILKIWIMSVQVQILVFKMICLKLADNVSFNKEMLWFSVVFCVFIGTKQLPLFFEQLVINETVQILWEENSVYTKHEIRTHILESWAMLLPLHYNSLIETCFAFWLGKAIKALGSKLDRPPPVLCVAPRSWGSASRLMSLGKCRHWGRRGGERWGWREIARWW